MAAAAAAAATAAAAAGAAAAGAISVAGAARPGQASAARVEGVVATARVEEGLTLFHRRTCRSPVTQREYLEIRPEENQIFSANI